MVEPGRSYSVTFALSRLITQLDTVRGRSIPFPYGKPQRYAHTGRFDDFYVRKATRPGTFFALEDIERLDRPRVTDLLASVPGFTVQDRQGQLYVRVARCTATSIRQRNVRPRGEDPGGGDEPATAEWLAIFVDGQKLQLGVSTLADMKTSDIETMEVYRGVSQLPAVAVGNACAAIFITTRYTPGRLADQRNQ